METSLISVALLPVIWSITPIFIVLSVFSRRAGLMDWSPADDYRLTVWEATQQLTASLERSESQAAQLLCHLGGYGDRARQLAGEDSVHDAVVSDACPAQASQVAFQRRFGERVLPETVDSLDQTLAILSGDPCQLFGCTALNPNRVAHAWPDPSR